MNRPKLHLFVPETPLPVEACPVETHSVGLGQAPGVPEHRVFVLLAPAGAPERGVLLHLSLDDARFLRDAIDTVLEQQRAIRENVN